MSRNIYQEVFSAGRPIPLIDISPFEWKTSRNDRNFDIGRDGKRFLMTRATKRNNRLVIVLNWLDEVERLVPLK